MRKLYKILQLHNENISLENRVYIIACTALCITCIAGLIENTILHLPFWLNASLSICVCIYAFLLRTALSNNFSLTYQVTFLATGAFFLLASWLWNGGITGITPLFFVFVLGTGILALTSRQSTVFSCFIISLIILLIVIEFIYPNVVTNYPDEMSRKADFVISTFFVSVILSVILIYYKRTYQLERERLLTANKAFEESHKALLHAKQEAEIATQAKSKFLATMSHEIRTPLNGIIGTVEVLKYTELTQDQQELLQTLQVSNTLLLEIINDLLDIAKIEADKLVILETETSIRKCVKEVFDLLQPRLKALQKNIQFYYHIEEGIVDHIMLDESRLKQLLINMLGNAIKFTDKGYVELQVKATLHRNIQTIQFQIKDTGIGIKPESLNKLFIPFSQVDESITRRHSGTGLGLAISKKLVELMGGTIHAASQVGQGSVFSFILPARIVKPGNVPAGSPVNSSLMNLLPHKPITILLAEDNMINQLITTKMLKQHGYVCDVAHDGEQAVNMVKKYHYDCVLMDIQMPYKDGVAATIEILDHCQQQALKPPVIIAITANAMKHDEERCLKSGMKDFLSKPFTPEQLIKAIHKWTAHNVAIKN
ncbi:MAG: response regulator [Filimonas sp.]|nr:response regulator [Filimonas sp.]